MIQEQDLTEQGRNKSAVLGNNIEVLMQDAGLSFLQALETTLKAYDHPHPAAPQGSDK